METESVYDVVVVGGGNAALCAAISAREEGASVLVLEAAPRQLRGGNSRHTRNLRCMHEEPCGRPDRVVSVLRVLGRPHASDGRPD